MEEACLLSVCFIYIIYITARDIRYANEVLPTNARGAVDVALPPLIGNFLMSFILTLPG